MNEEKVKLAHLETNVTLACQNRCVGCNHFVPMQRGEMRDALRIADDLEALGRVAHSPAWAAIGGEPLLHRELVEILWVARASGIADRVEVWTNGMLLRKQRYGFWSAVDDVFVTRYPGKLTDEDVAWINARGAEAGVAVHWKNGAQDFTRLLYQEKASKSEAQARFGRCWYRTYCHVVDDGYFYRCCTGPFVGPLVLGLPQGTDGLRVAGVTADELRAYLGQEETPAGCYRCAGHDGAHIGWRESVTREGWLAMSME